MISESCHKLSEKCEISPPRVEFNIKMPPIGACEVAWERKCSIGREHKKTYNNRNVDR